MRWTPLLILLASTALLSGLLLTMSRQPSFEDHLWRLLHTQRKDELNTLMKQNPDKVRDMLLKSLRAWTELEQKGAQAQALTRLQDTLDLTHAFDDLTKDGYRGYIEAYVSLSLEKRLLLIKNVSRSEEVDILIGRQQYEQALARLDRDEAANRDIGSSYVQASIHVQRGQIFLHQREFQAAQQQYEIALELYRQLGFKLELVFLESELGFLYSHFDRLSDARRHWESALAEQRRILALSNAANTLNSLGHLYNRMGDLRKGLAAFEQALQIRQQIQDDWNLPITLNNIGYTYYLLGDHMRARSFLEKALVASQAAGRDRVTGLVLNNLGELYFQTQGPKPAIEYLNRALEVKTKAKSSPYEIAYTLRALGEVYLSGGSWIEAEDYIKRALRETARSQTGVYEAILLAIVYDLQGKLFRGQGRFAEATSAFERAVQTVEDRLPSLDAHHWKTLLLSSGSDLYHDMILLQHEDLNNPEAAFEFSEKARARAFLDLLKGQDQSVRFEYGETRVGGAKRLQDVYSSDHAKPLDWASLRRTLPHNVSVVAYTVTQDKLLIWVLDAARLQSVAVPVSRKRLYQLVDALRGAVNLTRDFKQRFPTREAMLRETRARGAELYNHLIVPVKSLIHREQTICFVPDDVLYYVPFAALVDPDERKYMVETHTLFYAPSASILALSLERRQHRKPARPLLVVSNPEIGKKVQADYPYLRPLRDAEPSDRYIAQMFMGARLLKGTEASKPTLLAAMPDYEIVHLSTHGILDDKEPLYSSLVVAPGNEAASADDGQLFMYEFFKLKLPRTQLITLSACETALGTLWRGEGMVGMARAVFYAGVSSLVMTQWKVEDESAGRLMSVFYKRLRVQPNIAESLAQAQRACLQEAEDAWYSHPYYWSGFCLMGDYHLKINSKEEG